MKIFNKFLTVVALSLSLSFLNSGIASAQEAPDALIKRISQEVLATAKTDHSVQGGDQKRILDLIEAKILPYIDFDRMTRLAAGRFWRTATTDQKQQLTKEFRSLLIYTYSGALSQLKDQKLEFLPMRNAATDTEVEVRTQVIRARGGEPVQINYRLAKMSMGWKIYDVNILGAWLVETYKNSFAAEITRSGIDGLIKTLADRNQQLAANPPAVPKNPVAN